MSTQPAYPSWGQSQHLTDRVVLTLERFLHVEAVSGGVLIIAAVTALLWANSSAAALYYAVWQAEFTIGIGSRAISQSLHFLVNDGLMTIFFLVAGLEIRRELHEGALSNLKLATLPMVAALGGIIAPATIYLAFNYDTAAGYGWAVPIATDIAFALGVLALLGKSVPRGVRVLLLALAIIDDVVAVLVIAIFYSQALRLDGALIAAAAIVMVFLFQRLGIRAALAYLIPGAILWCGLLRFGVHPTLTGVILGLLTPVVSLAGRKQAAKFTHTLDQAAQRARTQHVDDRELVSSIRQISTAQRDLLPPVVTVQEALHPWVAYGIMPLFAFANAGVALTGTDLSDAASRLVALGVGLGLLIGKPLGILLASAIAIKLRWCELPQEVGWRGLSLVALLGGIGFTMSIFIANLGFDSAAMLATAKLAILLASFLAAILALILGKWRFAATQQ